jgi:uncharacterized protein YfaP (DUF2135 family)
MRHLVWLSVVLLLGVGLYSCNKNDSTTGAGPEPYTPSPISSTQQAAFRTAYGKIKTSADSALLTTSPEIAFQSRLTTYQSDTTVQSAWISGSALFITFKNGGTIFWNAVPSVAVPPYDGPSQAGVSSSTCLLKPSDKIGNTKALLINTQYTDENRQYCRDLVTYLSAKFTQRGFTVTAKNGNDADVSFFKTGMKGYGAIFYISHGCYDGTNTWQGTGEEGTMDSLMSQYGALWQTKRLSLGGSKELRSGVWKVVNHYTFSQKFIDSLYTGTTDFPNSLIYLVACQGMKDAGRQVAKSFNNKGARGVIGWDETNCLGQSTGKQLFNLLLCGANVKDALRALPAEAKSDPCAVSAGANLVYYPTSADTLRLVDSVKAKLQITSTFPESTYTARTLTLAGQLINGDTISSGIVEVNGVATTMTKSSYYPTFSQPIVIDSGANYIHISCNGKLTDGRCAFVDTTYRVYGNFRALDLWTELRWNTSNTDVDFHLLPPGASFPSAMWTTTDCYYSNKTPSWGGSLDVDDVDGYGPEHITIPSATTAGTYRLFVHYYSDHTDGTTPTSAYVTLSVRGGPNQNFGPYPLVVDSSRGGDIYEVCTITYPAGTVTAVNAKRSVGSMLSKTLPDPAYKRRK